MVEQRKKQQQQQHHLHHHHQQHSWETLTIYVTANNICKSGFLSYVLSLSRYISSFASLSLYIFLSFSLGKLFLFAAASRLHKMTVGQYTMRELHKEIAQSIVQHSIYTHIYIQYELSDCASVCAMCLIALHTASPLIL